jgi:uncharacterized membrane protein
MRANFPASPVTSRHPSNEEGALSPVLGRNIKALVDRRRREQAAASLQDRAADAITTFTGSMACVYFHLLVFGFWGAANLGWVPGIRPWDESFVVLAMVASVEAIFLSTFVLITQNRMNVDADKRADLDLQISLLTEHEITRMAILLAEIAKKAGVSDHTQRQMEEVKQDVKPEVVLEEIEKVDPEKANRSR